MIDLAKLSFMVDTRTGVDIIFTSMYHKLFTQKTLFSVHYIVWCSNHKSLFVQQCNKCKAMKKDKYIYSDVYVMDKAVHSCVISLANQLGLLFLLSQSRTFQIIFITLVTCESHILSSCNPMGMLHSTLAKRER